ncbi:hypothetical protein [Zavarzinia sp.]|jgi:hypothetical protein|uniref:hypothetical protein n=1 Tax=Zavarzinia sp. TaxID=2027920 RepID=UPI0035666D59
MSTLVKDLAPPTDLVALFTQVDGVLTDAYSVRFQVWDASAGLPGTQKLPAAGGWVTATAAPYKARTGVYTLIDPATGAAWIPTTAMARVHVLWEVVQAEGDSAAYVSQIHEAVTSAVTPIARAGIATIQDVKDYGLSSSYADRKIHEGLQQAMAIAERYCGQRLHLVHERKTIPGTSARVLFLSEPLFGLAAATLNEDPGTTDTTSLRVIGSTGPQRHNPSIMYASGRSRDIYSGGGGGGSFSHRAVQVLTGAWGFVEAETQQAPLAVQTAVVRLAYLMIARGAGGKGLAAGGTLRSEMTDGHMITFGASGRSGSLAVLQQDPQVRDALDLYRAPMAMGAPANDW